MAELTGRHAADGRIEWIGLRPDRRAPLTAVSSAELALSGLTGDHSRAGARALTLIQAEHLPVIGALSGHPDLRAEFLRRNIVIAGINLGALRGRRLRLGRALIELTVPCAPCSRMEEVLGHGGYNAMRGHGGWCARVIEPGPLRLGERAAPEE